MAAGVDRNWRDRRVRAGAHVHICQHCLGRRALWRQCRELAADPQPRVLGHGLLGRAPADRRAARALAAAPRSKHGQHHNRDRTSNARRHLRRVPQQREPVVALHLRHVRRRSAVLRQRSERRLERAVLARGLD
eukprot:Amastigsp_a514574_17.p4 type:complete len:134 gc:universal Amastigsp_a514574_17:626-225(-)